MMKIRAHHLLCLSRKYRHEGWYNSKLKSYAKKIILKLDKNPKKRIEIINKCDDICKKCPNIKRKRCNKPSKYDINHWVKVMDNKTLRLIKIKPNTIHKSSEVFKLIIKRIKNKELKRICNGCEHLDRCLRGINKSFIKELNKK